MFKKIYKKKLTFAELPKLGVNDNMALATRAGVQYVATTAFQVEILNSRIPG